jgi:gas vesicle protein
MKTSNSMIKLIGFSLVAGILGAGLGVLLAPHKGRKTRKKIKKAVKDIAKDIQGKIKNETNVINRKVEGLQDHTTSAIEDIVKDVKYMVNGLVHH